MIIRGGPQYLGPDKLSGLPFIVPNFSRPERDNRYSISRTSAGRLPPRVSKSCITPPSLTTSGPMRCPPPPPTFFRCHSSTCVADDAGTWSYHLSPAGEKCTFLRFLINTSNFTWKKKKAIAAGDLRQSLDDTEEYENTVHLIASSPPSAT